jgi:transcriptional regulator with PAS, ATPase and Fis domain
VHHYSLRCAKPWVDVSCAALPEHLVESELFGYERGAFSGADSPKPGLFELANHGTLFLDEVGELEPRMQVKLLRVLDGVAYYRLGGTRKVIVDVRIVAATNQDLEHMVETGQFRSDLYHRLGQICLRVPPLRERSEDIVPLAEHFLKQSNLNRYFSADAVQALQRHSWPGNVRELRNVLERAVILADQGTITKHHLPRDFGVPAGARPVLQEVEPDVVRLTVGTTVGEAEKALIQVTLQHTRNNKTRAAEILGISLKTLFNKLKEYGSAEAEAGTGA